MMRERSVFPNYETYDGNDLTPDRNVKLGKRLTMPMPLMNLKQLSNTP